MPKTSSIGNATLRRTIAFGFLLALSSGFGQTFFISLFNPELRKTFSLSHGDIGALYSIGTLLSAITVIWLGKLIDQVNLKTYTGFVTVGLAIACFVTAHVQSALMLAIAFYLLRLFGQGLSGHTGITTVTRQTTKYRGRGVSVAALGFSSAEIVLPLLTFYLISKLDWRGAWNIYGLIQLVGITLATQWLLLGMAGNSKTSDEYATDQHSWNRSQVMRDRRFWCVAPAIFSPPILSTALVFHQQSLAAAKGFELSQWATAIAAYSIAAVTTSLIAGVLVDKYSAAKIVRLYLVPFICSLLVTSVFNVPMLPFIYYGLIGATVGISMPTINSLWLELYGSQHIGSIRALTHACMVFGTAIGPLVFGHLLDNGVSWNALLIASAVWMLLATFIMLQVNLNWRQAPGVAT